MADTLAASPNWGDKGAALTHGLSEAERRFGPTAPELLPMLGSLAQFRYEQAAFAEATALRRRALKIAIASYGSGSLPEAEAMAALARLYIEQRRYLDAEPLTIAATNVLRDRLGERNVSLAPVLADQARVALANGDDKSARRWVEEAIEIDKDNLGAAQSDRLRVMGAVLAAEARFGDSEQALRRALALDRGNRDELASARSLAALADTELREKRFTEALPLIEEATWIDEDHLAAAHPLIAEDFHDLGLVYLGINRPGDAATALNTARDILERGAGRDTPTLAYVQLDLARAEHALGHEDTAKTLFTAARRILNAAEDEEGDRQRRA
jgi:tetratricopeptide (TPR) repeat protein